jgi:hypothetical protein
MEQSRWVTVDSGLCPLDQATIYPNAQEGAQIIAGLVCRYGNA